MTKYKNEVLKITNCDILDLFPLEYVKNYLRIDNDYDNDFLKNAIATACNYTEKITGKIIGLKTFTLNFSVNEKINTIYKENIYFKDIISLHNNENKIEKTDYYIQDGKCILKQSISGNINLIFKAGIPFNEILVDIRQAIMYHVAKIYNNKDGDFSIPQASMDIYNLYRQIKI